jgi:hypothetical protein
MYYNTECIGSWVLYKCTTILYRKRKNRDREKEGRERIERREGDNDGML